MSRVIPKIGIMQGRLSESVNNQIQSFPHETWKTEFEKAHSCKYEVLEWIFDDLKNPIMEDTEIDEIVLLSNKFNIEINSVCADYFMEKKLFNVNNLELKKNLNVLENLIIQCNKIGIKILEIPLVDSSSLQSDKNMNDFFQNILSILPQAEANNVLITLETDLPAEKFLTFLKKFNHPNIGANYDLGNSASLRYDVKEEIMSYGNFITNIHLKDRLYHGTTIPLGLGDANFDSFFEIISKIEYQGDLIIQGAREKINENEEPEQTCKKYRNFVKTYVDKYYGEFNIS